MNNNNNFSYLFKFIVIGDTGVGKSCLVLQFINQKVRKNHEVTIGVEFGVKKIKLNGKTIKLQIWDTAGQEIFKSLTRSYYRSACGALLVYDITKRDSFNNLEKWMQEVKENAVEGLTIMLIGNKCDLNSGRQISYEEGEIFAKKYGLLFLETSAFTAKNVENAFIKTADKIYGQIEKGDISVSDQTPGIKIGNEIKPSSPTLKSKKYKCC